MYKLVNPGVIEGHQVFCEIKIHKGILSISGVIGPKSDGDCWGSCGQIQNSMVGIELLPAWRDAFDKFLDVWDKWHLNDMRPNCEHQHYDTDAMVEVVDFGWTPEFYKTRKAVTDGLLDAAAYETFAEITKRVYAVTVEINRPVFISPEAQQLMDEGWIKISSTKTKRAGWVRYEQHPQGLLGKPCDVCGYKYGTRWLKEENPQEVIEFLEGLPTSENSLPVKWRTR